MKGLGKEIETEHSLTTYAVTPATGITTKLQLDAHRVPWSECIKNIPQPLRTSNRICRAGFLNRLQFVT